MEAPGHTDGKQSVVTTSPLRLLTIWCPQFESRWDRAGGGKFLGNQMVGVLHPHLENLEDFQCRRYTGSDPAYLSPVCTLSGQLSWRIWAELVTMPVSFPTDILGFHANQSKAELCAGLAQRHLCPMCLRSQGDSCP